MPIRYPKQTALSTGLRPWLNLALCALAALFLAAAPGCGGKDNAPQAPAREAESKDSILWAQEPKGITLDLTASPDLNMYEGKAHTLLLCLYQLEKREAFDALAATPDGLSRLLECGSFDPSVKMTSRIFLQPGENAAHTLDRVENARYAALACGYFSPSPVTAARVWEIPVNTRTEGWVWKTTYYSAGKLGLRLYLDAQGLREADKP